MPTDHKVRWIELEHAAGVREIEVGSFVSPKLLPQMADTAEVVKRVSHLNDLTVAVLIRIFEVVRPLSRQAPIRFRFRCR